MVPVYGPWLNLQWIVFDRFITRKLHDGNGRVVKVSLQVDPIPVSVQQGRHPVFQNMTFLTIKVSSSRAAWIVCPVYPKPEWIAVRWTTLRSDDEDILTEPFACLMKNRVAKRGLFFVSSNHSCRWTLVPRNSENVPVSMVRNPRTSLNTAAIGA